MTEINPKQLANSQTAASNNAANATRAKISSAQLFAKQNEVIIDHNGEDYRLRITSNGKLILTK